MTEVIVKIDVKTGKKVFNIDVGNMTADQSAALLELLNRTDRPTVPRPEGGYSFEEQYWLGLIAPADVCHLVEGWFQSELAEQYRSEPPDYPEFVSITKVAR